MPNASPSINGWNFQVTVGIILFFSDVRNILRIKIEGKDEDIEIFHADGKKTYCQAKTAYNFDSANKVALSRLKDALKSIDSNKDKANIFIYASNIINPVNVSSSRNAYNYNTIYNIDEIPVKDREKILKYVSDDFPIENLRIAIYQFGSDIDSRQKHAKYIIDKFFKSINIYNFNEHNLMDKYVNLFFDDACNRHIYKTKEDFIWPAIIVALDTLDNSDELIELLGNEEEVSNILNAYDDYINQKTVDYEFIIKYITGFADYSNDHSRARIIDFINDNYIRYLDDYSSLSNEDTKEMVAKMVMYKVLKNRSTINKIKNGANIKYGNN